MLFVIGFLTLRHWLCSRNHNSGNNGNNHNGNNGNNRNKGNNGSKGNNGNKTWLRGIMDWDRMDGGCRERRWLHVYLAVDFSVVDYGEAEVDLARCETLLVLSSLTPMRGDFMEGSRCWTVWWSFHSAPGAFSGRHLRNFTNDDEEHWALSSGSVCAGVNSLSFDLERL